MHRKEYSKKLTTKNTCGYNISNTRNYVGWYYFIVICFIKGVVKHNRERSTKMTFKSTESLYELMLKSLDARLSRFKFIVFKIG